MRRLGAVLLLAVLASAPAVADQVLFAYSGNTEEHFTPSSLIINGSSTFTFTTQQSEFTSGSQNRGWWSATQANYDFNDNYIVGHLGSDDINNFFTFDLAGLNTTTATSAELRLDRYASAGWPMTYYLSDVSTPAAVLNYNQDTSAAIFSDLGSGVSYGSVLVTDYFSPDPLVISLNASALAAINNAAGNPDTQGHAFFSIGGALRGSAPVTEIPEPSTCLMLGTALAGLAGLRRRWS